MPTALGAEHVEAYRCEGYLVVPGLYSAGEVARARELIEADLATGGWAQAPYHADDVTTDVYERVPELARLVLSGPYLRAMEALFGPDAWVIAEPAVHRGRYYGWHKDSTFLDAQGESFHWDDGFAAAMTVLYLQGNDPDHGGGITLVPRTHGDPDFYHRVPAMNPLQRAWLKAQKVAGVSHFDRMDKHPDCRAVATEAGDLLVLDLRLDHRGTPARRPPAVPKYGVMSIACRGGDTARRLSAALRRRPGRYYREYLAREPATTPVLEEIARAHGAQITL